MKEIKTADTRKVLAKHVLAVTVASLACTSLPSYSQVLEEVIVTAQRRTQSLQDVPVAVTAFNTVQLEQNVLLELRDLQDRTPSLFITQSQGSSSSVIVDIRGQVQNDASVTTLDPSVGIYFNGVYVGRAQGAMLELFDIASVEVLKGSQGTLYGRNTTGGAIKVETVKPEPGEPTTGFVGGAVGNYDSVRYEGAVSFPLGDTAAMRIAARHNESDGWGGALTIDPLTGDTTDSTDTNGRDADLVRGSLVWDATENLRLSFNAEYYENDEVGEVIKDQGGDRWTAPATFESTSNWNDTGASFKPEGRVENETYDLSIDYSFDSFDVKAIVAHRDWEFLNVFDVDASSFDLLSTILDADGDQDSVEIQFSGLAFDQKLNWLAGLYYFEEDANDVTDVIFGGNPIIYRGDVHAESAAVFTHLVYAFTDDLSLSAGVRYTEDTKELDGANRLFGSCVYDPSSPGVAPDGCSGSFSDDFDFVSWTLGVDWAFADSAMVYAKASQGQRSGGQNIRGTGPAFSPDQQAVVDTTAPFDEENVLDYEVGIKSEFMEGRARLNAAYYYTDYSDFQYSEVIAVSTYVANLGDAEVQGVELEGTFLIGEGLRIGGFFSWLDFDYDDSAFESESPEFKWGVDVNYSRSVDYGEWNATLGYTWTDERGDISSVSNDSNSFLPMDDYSVVNGRVQLAFNNGITIALFGRNLTDEEYSTNYLNSFLGNPLAGGLLDPDEAGIYAPGAPRTYGAELRYAF
jgi:iron complex outermembrane receptor protein